VGASGAGADGVMDPDREEGGATRVIARAADSAPVRLLFVCLGNICRSPTAEGVMRALVEREGLSNCIQLESAGTGAWHVGSAPDERATAAALAHGVELEGRARQVRPEDFEDFDLLLAMDGENLRELRRLAPGEEQRAKVRLLREFDPASNDGLPTGDLDVPDPYYGGAGGFDEVFELVQAACEGLLEQIRPRA
jgi:protein-tyrosine phosphatase